MPLGKILTGVKILSGLSGIFGGKKKSDPQQDNRLAILGKAKAADELGLHRLSVVGSGGSAYSQPISSDLPEGLGTIAEALEGYKADKDQEKRDKADNALRDKEAELIDAQIAESRSRTLMNVGNAKRQLTGPIPAVNGATGSGERGIQVQPTQDEPVTMIVETPDGKKNMVLNPAIGMDLSEMLATGAQLGANYYYRGAKWFYNRKKNQFEKFREKNRILQPRRQPPKRKNRPMDRRRQQ